MPKRTLRNYQNQINSMRQRLRRNEPMSQADRVEAAALLLTGKVMGQFSLQDVSTERKARETWKERLP